MSTFYIKQGDLSPVLQYQLLGAGGAIQVLTGSPAPAVLFRMFDKHPVWPLTGPTVSAVTGTPTSLQGGAYVLGYTYVPIFGSLETPVSGPSLIVNVIGGQVIQVVAPPLPSWASAFRWYFLQAPTGDTGFVVQNTGGTFTIGIVGNGVMPPLNVATELVLIQSDDVTGHVTIDNPTNGIVSYHWQAGDTATSGTYYADFTVTPSGGGPETFPNNDDLLISIKAK